MTITTEQATWFIQAFSALADNVERAVLGKRHVVEGSYSPPCSARATCCSKTCRAPRKTSLARAVAQWCRARRPASSSTTSCPATSPASPSTTVDSPTRLESAISAISELLDSYDALGEVRVELVTFGNEILHHRQRMDDGHQAKGAPEHHRYWWLHQLRGGTHGKPASLHDHRQTGIGAQHRLFPV